MKEKEINMLFKLIIKLEYESGNINKKRSWCWCCRQSNGLKNQKVMVEKKQK